MMVVQLIVTHRSLRGRGGVRVETPLAWPHAATLKKPGSSRGEARFLARPSMAPIAMIFVFFTT